MAYKDILRWRKIGEQSEVGNIEKGEYYMKMKHMELNEIGGSAQQRPTHTLSLAFLSAPASISSRTQSAWPFAAAHISAVHPPCDSDSPVPTQRHSHHIQAAKHIANTLKNAPCTHHMIYTILNIHIERKCRTRQSEI